MNLPAYEDCELKEHSLDAFEPISYIEQELRAGNNYIVIPSGVYKVTTQNNAYLTFKNLRNVTIDFTGVEFIGQVRTRMFDISNCENLTLKGLTFDYDPLPFTQAWITNIDRDKNWDIKVIDGYPAEDINSAKDCWPIQVYGKDSLELVNPMRFRDNIAVERTGEDTYHISGGIDRTGEIGDIVVFGFQHNSAGVGTTGIQSSNCINLQIENFTLYSSPGGVAFREICNTKTFYRNCVLDRRPLEIDIIPRGLKRLRSGNHDAFVCKNASIGPQLIGCTARYQCDDCVNISGVYSIVSTSMNGELRILDGHPILPEFNDINMAVGDSIQIMTLEGERLEDAVILSLEPDGERCEEEAQFLAQLELWPGLSDGFRNAYKIKLDRKETLPRGAIIISNNHCCNGFLIKDCTFGHARSRGLLIKASGVIENNTINNSCASGIQVSTEFIWLSGGCSSDLKIIGNTLRNNRGSGIYVGSRPFKANFHRNIVINNNTVTANSQGINVNGCTGLEMSGNTVEVTSVDKSHGIILDNVVDVKQDNNQVI